MKWETVSIPDWVNNLANHLTCILEESPKRETTKILSFQLWQMEAPKQNQKPPGLCCCCKEPEHWEEDCYQFKEAVAL